MCKSREMAGMELFEASKIKYLGKPDENTEEYEVQGGDNYRVIYDLELDQYFCQCPDHTYRQLDCKHINGVKNFRKYMKQTVNISLDLFGFSHDGVAV